MDISKAEEGTDDKMEDCQTKGSSQHGESSSEPVLDKIQYGLVNSPTVPALLERNDTDVPCPDIASTHPPVHLNIQTEDMMDTKTLDDNQDDLGNNTTVSKSLENSGTVVLCPNSASTLMSVNTTIPEEDILMDTEISGNVVDFPVKSTDDLGISSELEQELLCDEILESTPPSTKDVEDVNKLVESPTNDAENQLEVLQPSSAVKETGNIEDPQSDHVISSENIITNPELSAEVSNKREDDSCTSNKEAANVNDPLIESDTKVIDPDVQNDPSLSQLHVEIPCKLEVDTSSSNQAAANINESLIEQCQAKVLDPAIHSDLTCPQPHLEASSKQDDNVLSLLPLTEHTETEAIDPEVNSDSSLFQPLVEVSSKLNDNLASSNQETPNIIDSLTENSETKIIDPDINSDSSLSQSQLELSSTLDEDVNPSNQEIENITEQKMKTEDSTEKLLQCPFQETSPTEDTMQVANKIIDEDKKPQQDNTTADINNMEIIFENSKDYNLSLLPECDEKNLSETSKTENNEDQETITDKEVKYEVISTVDEAKFVVNNKEAIVLKWYENSKDYNLSLLPECDENNLSESHKTVNEEKEVKYEVIPSIDEAKFVENNKEAIVLKWYDVESSKLEAELSNNEKKIEIKTENCDGVIKGESKFELTETQIGAENKTETVTVSSLDCVNIEYISTDHNTVETSQSHKEKLNGPEDCSKDLTNNIEQKVQDTMETIFKHLENIENQLDKSEADILSVSENKLEVSQFREQKIELATSDVNNTGAVGVVLTLLTNCETEIPICKEEVSNELLSSVLTTLPTNDSVMKVDDGITVDKTETSSLQFDNNPPNKLDNNGLPQNTKALQEQATTSSIKALETTEIETNDSKIQTSFSELQSNTFETNIVSVNESPHDNLIKLEDNTTNKDIISFTHINNAALITDSVTNKEDLMPNSIFDSTVILSTENNKSHCDSSKTEESNIISTQLIDAASNMPLETNLINIETALKNSADSESPMLLSNEDLIAIEDQISENMLASIDNNETTVPSVSASSINDSKVDSVHITAVKSDTYTSIIVKNENTETSIEINKNTKKEICEYNETNSEEVKSEPPRLSYDSTDIHAPCMTSTNLTNLDESVTPSTETNYVKIKEEISLECFPGAILSTENSTEDTLLTVKLENLPECEALVLPVSHTEISGIEEEKAEENSVNVDSIPETSKPEEVMGVAVKEVNLEVPPSKSTEVLPEVIKTEEVVILESTASEAAVSLVSLTEVEINKEESNSENLQTIPESKSDDVPVVTIKTIGEIASVIPHIETNMDKEENSCKNAEIVPEVTSKAIDFKVSPTDISVEPVSVNETDDKKIERSSLETSPEIIETTMIITKSSEIIKESIAPLTLTKIDVKNKEETDLNMITSSNVSKPEEIVTEDPGEVKVSTLVVTEEQLNLPLVTEAIVHKSVENSTEVPKEPVILASNASEVDMISDMIENTIPISSTEDNEKKLETTLEASKPEFVVPTANKSTEREVPLLAITKETSLAPRVTTNNDNNKQYKYEMIPVPNKPEEILAVTVDLTPTSEVIQSTTIIPSAEGDVNEREAVLKSEEVLIQAPSTSNLEPPAIVEERAVVLFDRNWENILKPTASTEKVETSIPTVIDVILQEPTSGSKSCDTKEAEVLITETSLAEINIKPETLLETKNITDSEFQFENLISSTSSEATECKEVENAIEHKVEISSEEMNTQVEICVPASTDNSEHFTTTSESAVPEVEETIPVLETISEEVQPQVNILDTTSNIIVSSVEPEKVVSPFVEGDGIKMEETCAQVGLAAGKSEPTSDLVSTTCADDLLCMNEDELNAVEESIMNVEDSLEDDQLEMEALLLDTDPSDFQAAMRNKIENNTLNVDFKSKPIISTNINDLNKKSETPSVIETLERNIASDIPEIEAEILPTNLQSEVESSLVNVKDTSKEADQPKNEPDSLELKSETPLPTYSSSELVNTEDAIHLENEEVDIVAKEDLNSLENELSHPADNSNEIPETSSTLRQASCMSDVGVIAMEDPKNVEAILEQSKSEMADLPLATEPSDAEAISKTSLETDNLEASSEPMVDYPLQSTDSNNLKIKTDVSDKVSKELERQVTIKTSCEVEKPEASLTDNTELKIDNLPPNIVFSADENSSYRDTDNNAHEGTSTTETDVPLKTELSKTVLEAPIISHESLETSSETINSSVVTVIDEKDSLSINNQANRDNTCNIIISSVITCERESIIEKLINSNQEEQNIENISEEINMETDTSVSTCMDRNEENTSSSLEVPVLNSDASIKIDREVQETIENITENINNAVDNTIPTSLESEQVNPDNKSIVQMEKPSDCNIEVNITDNNTNLSESNNAKDEETQEVEQKSGIIILSSTSLAPEENYFALEAKSTEQEVLEPVVSETSNISVQSKEVKEIITPVKEKILKIVTDEGIVQYIKIPVSFHIPNISQMFSQSDNNTETLQAQKEASPEKLKEDVTCKGCKTKLIKHSMYHPCIDNWCRFCEQSLSSNTIFELHTIEKHHNINKKTCAFCEKECVSPQHLENHLKTHTHFRLAPSVCVGCKTQFNTSEGRREHTCSSPLLCTICNISLPSEEKLTHHQVTRHKVSSGGMLSRQPSIETPVMQLEEVDTVNMEVNEQSVDQVIDSSILTIKSEDVNTAEDTDVEDTNTPLNTISCVSSQTSEVLTDEVGATLESIIERVVKLKESVESESSCENVWGILMNDTVNTEITKVLQQNYNNACTTSLEQHKERSDSHQTTSTKADSVILSSRDAKSGEENIESSFSDGESIKPKKEIPQPEEIEIPNNTSSVEEVKVLEQLNDFIKLHNITRKTTDTQSSDNSSLQMKFVCDICDRGLKTEADLVNHRTWHFDSCAAPKNREVQDPTLIDDNTIKEKAKVTSNENTTDQLPHPTQLSVTPSDEEVLACLALIEEEKVREYVLPDKVDDIVSKVEESASTVLALDSVEVEKQVDVVVDTEELSKELNKLREDVFNEEIDKEKTRMLEAPTNLDVTVDILPAQEVILSDVDTSSQVQHEVSESQDLQRECPVSNSQDLESEVFGTVQDVIDKAVSRVYEDADDYDAAIKKEVAASIVDNMAVSIQKAFGEQNTPLVSAREVRIEEPTSTVPCPHCTQSFSSFTTLNYHFIDNKFCKFCDLTYPKDYELHMVEYHSVEKMCQFCDKNFRHAKDLSSHMKIHTLLQFKPFVCSKCNVAFNKTDYLKHNTCQPSHKNKTVLELNLFCDKCQIYFQSDVSLENHMIEHHSVKDVCPICKQKFNSLLELVTHLGTHNSIKQIVYKCQKCFLNTTSESEFDNHPCIPEPQDLNVSSESSDNDNLKCELCNDEFATEEDKLAHGCCEETSVTDNKCDVCDIIFETRINFEKHMMSNHSSRNECQFCHRKLGNLSALKAHIKKHTSIKHPINPLTPSWRTRKESETEQPKNKIKPEEEEIEPQAHVENLYCKSCEVKYLKRDSFELHMMEFHSSLDLCQFCDTKFTNRTLLSQHIITHTKLQHMPHKCDKCSTRFSKAAELIVHHMVPCEIFTCEDCDVVFECEEEYKVHTNEQHLLSCEFCLEYFKSKQELASHIRIHSSKDALLCKDCNIKFKNIYEKTIHVCSSIKEEKCDFNCEICNKGFKNKQLLDKHATEHETQAEDITEECTYCKKKFRNSQYLKLHLKYCQSNKEAPSQRKCKVCKIEFKTVALMTKHKCKPQDLTCKICKLSCKNNNEFEQHMIETHTSCDTCQFCKQKFKQTQSLLLHLSKHTSFKPLQLKCEYCKLKFFQGDDMESHECVTKKKDFKCCVCPKVFTTAYWLASHLTKQHSIMELLPEVCGTCDTQFSNRRQLHRHPCPVGLPQEEPYVSLPFDDQAATRVTIKEEIDIKQEPLWDDSSNNASNSAASSSRGVLCTHCEEVYDTKNLLNEHLCKVNYCKRCSILLPSSKSFNSHMMTFHCNLKTCQFCDRVFRKTEELVKHILLHTSIKHKYASKLSKSKVTTEKEANKSSLFCKFCNKTFGNKHGFELHMMSKHCLKSACQFCDKVFPIKENLIAHIATHTKFPYRYYNKCEKCNKKFLDDLQEIYHKCPMDKKSENVDKPAETVENETVKANTAEATEKKICLICNKRFNSQPMFENHMMDLHQMKMICPFCGLHCKKRGGLVKHLSIHTSIQPKSVCMQCSELCDLSKHKCTQLADTVEPSAKKQKLESTSEKSSLRKRTREDDLLQDMEDSSSSLDLENPPKLRKEGGGTVKCLLCAIMFDDKNDMHSHIQDHHRVDVNSLLLLQGVKATEEESTSTCEVSNLDLTCLHCNKTFANAADLRLHGQKARVYCEFCKKTYPSQGEYESHMLGQHSMSRTCQFCGAQFSSKTGLLLHLRKHTSLKPINFKCFGCGEKFLTKMERQRHDCLACKCTICDQKFDSEEALCVHKETHKQQPTYKCEPCDCFFTTETDLEEHVKSSHPQKVETRKRGRPLKSAQPSKLPRVENVKQKEPIFSCEGHCEKTFSSQDLLYIHKKCICQTCKEEFKTPIECDQHQVSEHQAFICKLCGQVFIKQIFLNKHLSWHDLNDAKTSTAPPEPLPPRRAVSAAASKPPPQVIRCDTCGKEMKSNFALQMHLKTHRVYQCELCTRVFTSAQKLSAHTRLHAPPASVEEDSDDDVVVIEEIVAPTSGQFVLLD